MAALRGLSNAYSGSAATPLRGSAGHDAQINAAPQKEPEVLVYEEVWDDVRETLNLVSIPGMREALAAAEEVMDENRTVLQALA